LDIALEGREFTHRVNTSEGAGALVRVAPIGCLVPPAHAFEAGVMNAGYTHGGTSAYLACGYLSLVVANLVAGSVPQASLVAAKRELDSWPHNARTLDVVSAVLADHPLPSGASHSSKALYHGLRFMSHEGDLRKGLALVASESGTAAATIAGGLWGAVHGASSMPAEARAASELSIIVDELADAMAQGHRVWVLGQFLRAPSDNEFDDDGSPTAHMLWERFPGY
jgi:ADP-ribosylglycohydrolase